MRTTAEDESPDAAPSLHILCIEDEPADVELCQQCLEKAGFDVCLDRVETREQFLARIQSTVYDLVLGDYRLPGWTGLEAVEHLRQLNIGAPFVLVTGALGEETAVECLKRGVADYVLKDRLGRLPMAVARCLEEKRLREARARGEEAMAHLAAIVESSDDAIIGTDLEGHILSWNPAAARILGHAPAEAQGCALATVIPPCPRRLSWEEVFGKVRAGETVRNYEVNPIWRGSRQVFLSLTVSPVRDPQGKVASVAAIARDITRHRHLEEQLRLKNQALLEQNRRAEAANHMKSEFLAGMSHELRTPLNSIIGLAELLHDGKLGPVSEGHLEYLGDILNSARHLLRLINDVLDLSKVEAGRLEFRPEPVQLDRLAEEVRDVLRLLAAKKQIDVAVEVAPEVNQVMADAARLKQVLYNLLSNALKFTPDGGQVWVRVKSSGPEAFRLEVEDTGIGIRAEDLPRLFQEFQQLDPGTVRKYGGSGLGLALTKRIVEAQGGRVGVRSTPNQGSVFYAVLPRVGELGTMVWSDNGPRILLVEAVPASAAWLGQALRRAGYGVMTAATGFAAAAACQTQTFAGFVVDLLLPDATGWEVLRRIRASEANRDTPVILVCGPEGRGLAAAFAVDDFLTRPVEAEALRASLERPGFPAAQARTVVVVDDDPEALREAEFLLAPLGCRVICCTGLGAGLAAVAESHPGLVIVGLLMRDLEDLGGLLRLRRNSAGRRVRLVTWARRELFEAERERLNTMGRRLALRASKGAEALLGELAAVLRMPGASLARRATAAR